MGRGFMLCCVPTPRRTNPRVSPSPSSRSTVILTRNEKFDATYSKSDFESANKMKNAIITEEKTAPNLFKVPETRFQPGMYLEVLLATPKGPLCVGRIQTLDSEGYLHIRPLSNFYLD